MQVVPVFLVVLSLFFASQAAEKTASMAPSPDGELVVRLYSSAGNHKNANRVEIRVKNGPFLQVHDFFSPDGDHGYALNQSEWTKNSQFFVMSMTNTGGHSPMHSPIVVWSRGRNEFYELPNYTAEHGLKLLAPDRLQVSAWPSLKPATISLSGVPKNQTLVIH